METWLVRNISQQTYSSFNVNILRWKLNSPIRQDFPDPLNKEGNTVNFKKLEKGPSWADTKSTNSYFLGPIFIGNKK